MKPIAPTTLHPMTCRCSECRPKETPADSYLRPNDIALLAIAGVIVGLILAELVDWMIAGPGVIPELGL
ncbi:hypothetical protein KV697_10715 [Sphingomonas sanguinis]|uniref:hypothetical protein n=1 Tax=Sphingomonas sanguinis TaxID=33051 RepID=UPI001C580B89|nr:hypothetical protein [Sphingomonas sanguinis]QXT34306.1 hypothetical protein KV697_10715 [Sphingomonas sanguinis]